jgi:branched-chain amino acid aminotransferase
MADQLGAGHRPVWVDGELRPPGAATVSVFDHGLTVGDGVFETVKAVAGQPFALTRHLDRLARSAHGLGLPAPDLDVARSAVAATLAAQPDPTADLRVRITYTGGVSPLGSDRGDAGPTLVVAAVPLAETAASSAVVTVPWPRNERGALAGLKTTSYAENVVALAHARARGASEAICADTTGRLCEGTGSNVLLSSGGRLVTPTLATGCLAGVTRALVLEWCDVVEQDVPMEAIHEADEVALVSTTRNVQPVHRVDDRELAVPGPLTAAAAVAWLTAASTRVDP